MTSLTTFENFAAVDVQAQDTRIFLRRFGAGPAVLLLHGFPQTHLMWRSVAPLLARRFTVICADLRGYGRLRTMRPMRNGPWRETWFRSWRSSDSRASQSPGMIGAVGSPTASRLIIQSEWNVSLSLTFFRPPTPGSGPTSGWRPRSGRGRCWRSPSRCLSGCCQPPLMPSSMTRLAVGGLPQMRSALKCGRRISRRCVIPLASMQSARNIERRRPSTTSMIWRIAEPDDR